MHSSANMLIQRRKLFHQELPAIGMIGNDSMISLFVLR